LNKDIIGSRGEVLFRYVITRWCRGKPWFLESFMGEKAEGLDFEVTLLGSSSFHANFFVQVKATAKQKRYSGRGNRRKIRVRLKAADARKLGTMKIPVYIVAVDVISERAYIKNVKAGATKGFDGMSTQHPLNCNAIRRLWQEVEEYWKSRSDGLSTSAF
jgi:uncharacterized protein DUF4365